MEIALIRCSLQVLRFGVELRDIRRLHIGTVQWNITNSRCRLRLVGKRLRNEEVVDRWRSGCPCVAKDLLLVAIDNSELRT
jgi:hypothetical protein